MENLQDVAASIAAVQGEAIDDFGIRNFADITQLTSGVSMEQSTQSVNSAIWPLSAANYFRY